MSDMISTPSRPPRARHQHSKSATPVAFHSNEYEVPYANQPNSTGNQRRPRRNRNNFVYNQGFTNQFYGEAQYPPPSGQQSPTTFQKAGDGETGSDSATGIPAARDRQPRQRSGKQNGKDGRPQYNDAQTRTNPITVMGQGPASTPVKSQAYAGPAFHASPMPSALPIPTKFLSKSVPETKLPQSLRGRMDNESNESSSPPTSSSPVTSSPPPASSSPPTSESSVDLHERPRPEPSPLDILFNADRAEKAKRNPAVLSPGVPSVAVSTIPDAAGTSINSFPQGKPFHNRQASNDAGKGLFVMELDASTNPSGSGSSPPNQPVVHPKQRDAVNQSLKDMLFSLADRKEAHSSPIPPLLSTPSEPASRFQSPSPSFHPNSVPRSHSGPTTPLYDRGMPSHYGNRNLSPLFHAAKDHAGPNTKRMSSLRKEVTPSSPNPFDSFSPSTPTANRPPQVSSIKARVPSIHILQNPFKGQNVFPYQHHPTEVASAPNLGTQRASPVVSPSPSRFQKFHPTKALDVKSMEDDLRRILNLNVLRSPSTAAPGI